MTIDWEAALGFADGSQELLLDLIDIFFLERAELMPKISAAVAAGDAAELHLNAHRLKGCLRYFGETKAGETAWQLELLGRANVMDDAAKLHHQLQTAVDELLPAMQAYKQEHKQP